MPSNYNNLAKERLGEIVPIYLKHCVIGRGLSEKTINIIPATLAEQVIIRGSEPGIQNHRLHRISKREHRGALRFILRRTTYFFLRTPTFFIYNPVVPHLHFITNQVFVMLLQKELLERKIGLF